MPPPSTASPKLREDGSPLASRVQDAIWNTLTPLAKRVGATPIMGASPPPWIRPDIISTSGFAQVATGATPFLPVTAFHKDALGYVHGKLGLVTAAGAGPVTVFPMPVGYRPAETLSFFGGDGGGVNVWEFAVFQNGDLQIVSALGAGGLVVATFTYLAEH